MSRTGVRILMGVAAAALAVGGLLQPRSEPDLPADAASLDTGPAAAPDGLAPDPRARAGPGLENRARVEATAAPRPVGPGLRGRVVRPSGGLEGFRIRVSGRGDDIDPVRTQDPWLASDGTFDVSLPAEAAVFVHVSWDGGEARFGPIASSSAEAPEVRFEFGTATLEGRLLDASGKPRPGGLLRLRPTSLDGATPSERQVSIDAEGRWRFDRLAAGAYVLDWDRPSPRSRGPEPVWRGEWVSLAEGEHRSVPLGATPTDVTWTGTVRLRSGAPLPVAGHLHLFRQDARFLHLPFDARGAFRVAAPPGIYDLSLVPRGPRLHLALELPPTLRPPKSPVASSDEVLLDHDLDADVVVIGGTVSGRTLGIAPPAPTRDAIRVAFHPAEPPARIPTAGVEPFLEDPGNDGHFVAYGLPAGRYVVTGSLAGRTVDLVGPDGQPVVVDVVEGGEITGLELNVARP